MSVRKTKFLGKKRYDPITCFSSGDDVYVCLMFIIVDINRNKK